MSHVGEFIDLFEGLLELILPILPTLRARDFRVIYIKLYEYKVNIQSITICTYIYIYISTHSVTYVVMNSTYIYIWLHIVIHVWHHPENFSRVILFVQQEAHCSVGSKPMSYQVEICSGSIPTCHPQNYPADQNLVLLHIQSFRRSVHGDVYSGNQLATYQRFLQN